jgi:signal transduction histidine kinase/DNA-binding response OmpR family regulator/putative methionine-R-sulfoxide reductase with GAF domain
MGEQDAILVIDHDPDAALLLSDFLEREGYAVAVARTGTEGLRLIRQGRFALVLLDLDLPDVDGTGLMREAGRIETPPEIIVVTGRATLDSAIQAVESRSAGYILKPVDLSRLGAIVARVFDRRRLAQDNERLHAELAERLAESEALAAISATVSSTLDVREALRRICRELVRLLGADTGAVYLQDRSSGSLVPTAAYHVPREYLQTLSSTPLPLKQQGFFLPLWQERRPIYSDDVARDARFAHGMFGSFPHQSALLLPLIVEDEVIGGFYAVWWTARRTFAERELRGLDHVCEQVGFFLRNARLYEQAERNQHRLEVLNDVSRRLAAVHDPKEVLTVIVNEAARLIGAEAAGLRLLEGDDLVVGARTEGAAGVMARSRLKVGESLSGLVVASGEPLVVEDLAEDTRYDPAHKRGALERGFRGFIGVPLRAHGRTVGTLNVFTKGARHFLPDEVALLSALADQASLAIEKARLLRETEEGRALLERLSHAAILMQSSWERGDRLAAFVRAARDVVGFDRVNVFLLTADGSELEPVTTGDDGEPPGLRLPVTPAAGPYHEALMSRRPVAVLSDADLVRLLPLDRTHLDHPYLRSRRFVIAPLVVGDRVIGVVGADNKPSRRPISRGSIEPFSSLCQNLAMALEESRLYAEARAREEEMRRREGEAKTLSDGLALLNQAARPLHRTLEVDAMLDGALKELAKAFGAGGALLELQGDDGGLSRSVGHWLSSGQRGGDPGRPGGISDHVRRTRAPLLLRDVTKHPDFVHPANLAHGVRSIAAYPIVGQNERVLGVLVLYYQTAQAFGEIETRLLFSYTDQLATALENAGLYEETQTQRVRLAQIFDSTSDGILLVSREGEIQAANRQAGELLGFDPSSVIGVRLAQLAAGRRSSTPDSDRVFDDLGGILEKPDLGGGGDLELPLRGKTVHWAGRPIKDIAGTTIGFTLTLHDVTHERQVSQMKTDFVSFVTHQLRTPLAGIKWMLELAAQSSQLTTDAGSYVDDARTAAERLIGLVNDLLDISRLESGKLTVTLQPTNLGQLTHSALDDLGALIRDKGLRLTLVGVEDAPMVMADPQLLRQVMVNLTSNALKYTPSGGDISIRIDREDARTVRWTITDSGIGIPRTALGRLFEKFYRAENVHTVETEGTGLGLYLVRLIIERLAGEVWCESEEGRGSAFIFTLPISE